MAHTEEMLVNGTMMPVTVFDQTAQAIDDAAAGFPQIKQDLVGKAPLESPAFTGTPTLNGIPIGTGGGGGIGRNLLDNWYFGNPVDQRGGYVVPPNTDYLVYGKPGYLGKTDKYYPIHRWIDDGYGIYPMFYMNGTEYQAATVVRGYTGEGYTIDRWIYGECHLAESSVVLHANQTMYNRLPPEGIKDKTLTVSALIDGILYTAAGKPSEHFGNTYISCGYDGALDTVWVGVTNPFSDRTVSVAAAKLELGTQQTLAHQENGEWVLNEIPNYAEELAKCQRYQLVIGDESHNSPVGAGQIMNTTTCIVYVPTPVSMRSRPNVSFAGQVNIRSAETYKTASILGVDEYGQGCIMLRCESSGLTAGRACECFTSAGAKIIFDANL